MTKKFRASCLFFTVTDLLQILVKKPISLIFFSKNCQIIENNSVLPLSTIPITTDQYLANIEFVKDDIKRIICKLDPNKAHGYDMISICMLKMSGDTIIKLLQIIQKLLKMWNISRWLEKRKHRFFKKVTNKISKIIV